MPTVAIMPHPTARNAAHELEADGASFASLCWRPWAGRVMSVPQTPAFVIRGTNSL